MTFTWSTRPWPDTSDLQPNQSRLEKMLWLFSTPSVTSLELWQAHLLEPSKWCCAPQLAMWTADFTRPGGHEQLKCAQKDIWETRLPRGSRNRSKGWCSEGRRQRERPFPRGCSTAGSGAAPAYACLPSAAQHTQPWSQVLFYKQDISTIN